MPAPEGTKAKTLFLAPDLIRRVQIAARVEGRTQSDVARDALEAYLGRLAKSVKTPLKPPGRRREPTLTP